jgi:hypothetical protein
MGLPQWDDAVPKWCGQKSFLSHSSAGSDAGITKNLERSSKISEKVCGSLRTSVKKSGNISGSFQKSLPEFLKILKLVQHFSRTF